MIASDGLFPFADGLDAAINAGATACIQPGGTDQMKEAKQEAAGIVDQANKRANQIVEEAKQQAITEGDRLKVAAEAEIEQEINRAKEELRASVAGLALAGAEKVLEASIDDKANRALVDNLASQL